MSKELKSLLVLSVFALHLGVSDTHADGPGRTSSPVSGSSVQTAAMGEYAGAERTQAAVGHYARARALLVEAMREFDAGKDIARPDLILNSETWKAGVSARADELAHVISPEGRETAGGTRFKENKSLLNEKFDAPKKVASSSPAPRVSKKVKREQVLVSAEKREANFARARMTEISEPVAVEIPENKSAKIIKVPLEPVAPKKEVETPDATNTEDEKDLSELISAGKADAVKSDNSEVDVELEKAADAELSRSMEESTAQEKTRVAGEGRTAAPSTGESATEAETAKSINDDEIRARLKKLSEEIAQEEKNKR